MKVQILFILLLLSIASNAQKTKKLLFIGIDACRWDAVEASNSPALKKLKSKAIFSPDGLCDYKTLSGNGWSSMLTGVWHTKHGVIDNSFLGANYDVYPDFITRLEAFKPKLKTISSVHWPPLNDTIIKDADYQFTFATDLEVKDGAINALENDDPDVLFVAFDDVDKAGHGFGFSPTIPEYRTAIEITDGYIAKIISAMEKRPNYPNEDWLVIVTTDHGGNVFGHGGGTLEERTIFNLFSNENLTPHVLSREVINKIDTYQEAHFDSASYAQPIDQSTFNFGTDQNFTIELWVKPSSFTQDPTFISNKDWNSGFNPGFVISGHQFVFWKVNIGDGLDRLDVTGGYLLPDQWHHLAVSFDRKGLMVVYEDGVVVGRENMKNIDNINTGLPLIINQDGTKTYQYNFDGSYKDIRIWNEVIPEKTIIEWANKKIDDTHPYYQNLLANWECNEITGNTLIDSSPNQNDCEVTGNIDWNAAKTDTFTVYDYTNTTREPDNAVTAMTWMCLPIEEDWGLDGKSYVEECDLTSVNNIEKQNDFIVYPNPASDWVTVEFKSFNNNSEILIFDTMNRLIKKLIIDSSSIRYNLQDLNSGFYYLKIGNKYNKILKLL